MCISLLKTPAQTRMVDGKIRGGDRDCGVSPSSAPAWLRAMRPWDGGQLPEPIHFLLLLPSYLPPKRIQDFIPQSRMQSVSGISVCLWRGQHSAMCPRAEGMAVWAWGQPHPSRPVWTLWKEAQGGSFRRQPKTAKQWSRHLRADLTTKGLRGNGAKLRGNVDGPLWTKEKEKAQRTFQPAKCIS